MNQRWGGLNIRRAILATGLAILAALLFAGWLFAPTGAAQVTSEVARVPVSNAVRQARPDDSDLWEKRWWIEKTARLLRGGEGLGPDDDVQALLRLSEEEIARRFMNDPRFGDTILDFNMYFLGFKSDDLKSDGVYKRSTFDFPSAVSAAQALLTGGDYFKLFDFEGDFFMAPLRIDPLDDPPLPGEENLTPRQMRRKVVDEMQAVFADLLAVATAPGPPPRQRLCKKILDIVNRRDEITASIYRAFDDAEIFVLMRGQMISAPIDLLERASAEECDGKSRSPLDEVRFLTAAIRKASEQFSRAFAELLKFEPEEYEPQTVLEFKRFDLNALPVKRPWLAFGYEQAQALQNSSTNYNRKRAAYVLKRFFCDDLTPVGFEDPQEHIGGAHGSTTSCYACHYKLDPMAGFFRGLGFQFNDYMRAEEILFDDFAEMSSRRFESNWRARRGSGRKWDIGYVRSPRWESLNSYGETLSDLSKIIRSAPEAKRCLMKRLFEYVTAENQTIDGGYLEHLTRTFEIEAAQNSSEAMKNAIVRVLQSRTYHQRNPDPAQCYDRFTDAESKRGPPCRVAHILRKNCAQCHDTAYDGDAGLDLGAWVTAPDGRSQTFPHLDHEMQQKPPQDTLTKIMERLSSTNPKTRMPKNKVMSSQERQELYLWAQQELARLVQDDGK